MPPFGPIKRKDLIRILSKIGFSGPYPGGRHEYMVHDALRLTIPNPHEGEISKPLLLKLLKQAGLSREEWEKL